MILLLFSSLIDIVSYFDQIAFDAVSVNQMRNWTVRTDFAHDSLLCENN